MLDFTTPWQVGAIQTGVKRSIKGIAYRYNQLYTSSVIMVCDEWKGIIFAGV